MHLAPMTNRPLVDAEAVTAIFRLNHLLLFVGKLVCSRERTKCSSLILSLRKQADSGLVV
jgi:hypothetical protein